MLRRKKLIYPPLRAWRTQDITVKVPNCTRQLAKQRLILPRHSDAQRRRPGSQHQFHCAHILLPFGCRLVITAIVRRAHSGLTALESAHSRLTGTDPACARDLRTAAAPKLHPYSLKTTTSTLYKKSNVPAVSSNIVMALIAFVANRASKPVLSLQLVFYHKNAPFGLSLRKEK